MLQQYIACKSAFKYLIALESKILRGNIIFLKIRFHSLKAGRKGVRLGKAYSLI